MRTTSPSRRPTMRSVLRRLRSLLAEGPRVLPFVPVIARRLLRRRRRLEAGLATVRRSRPAAVTPPDPATGLTVFSIVRNGITNGYPFIEAYGSWLRDADRIVIVDGESDDGTKDALDELAVIAPHVEVVSRPWPAVTTGGGAIAELTQTGLELARLGASRLAYVQADEIFTPEQRTRMRVVTPTALEFGGCINFWNSFGAVLENEFPLHYVRAFPADGSVHSIGDGFSFELGSIPVERTTDEILHYGWCFPVNILRKHISHSRLYSDQPAYVARGRLARLLLETGSYDRRLLDALAPHYRPVPYEGEHPLAVEHLLDQAVYDPNRGLDLLAAGAAW
jgi:hypothetical protein